MALQLLNLANPPKKDETCAASLPLPPGAWEDALAVGAKGATAGSKWSSTDVRHVFHRMGARDIHVRRNLRLRTR